MTGIQVGKYDSRRKRLQAASGRGHIGITSVTGTALTSSAGNGYYASETLETIKHGLGYKPEVRAYFYVSPSYALGKYFFDFGAFDDYVGYTVDEENLYIVHILDDTALNVGTTSDAPSFGAVRVKYTIFSNPVNKVTGTQDT